MQFLRQNRKLLVSIFSVLSPILLTFPAFAQDGDRSVETTTQAVQTWGQAIIDQKTAHLQQTLAAAIVLQYETELAQQASGYMEQVAVALGVDMEPVILPSPNEMLANAVVADDEDGCAY